MSIRALSTNEFGSPSNMKMVEPSLGSVNKRTSTAKQGALIKNVSARRLPHSFNQMNIQHQLNVHTAKFGVIDDDDEEEKEKKVVKKKSKLKKDVPRLPSEELASSSYLKSRLSPINLEEQLSGRSSATSISSRSHINPLLTPILDEDFKRERFEETLNKSLKEKSFEGEKKSGLSSLRSSNDMDLAPMSTRKKDEELQRSTLEPIKRPLSRTSDSKLLGTSVTTTHSNRAKLCIQSLAEGYVDAFEELFLLAHRDPVLVDDITDTYFTLTDDRLRSIKEMLVQAESYKRRGKFEKVYDIFKQIADYFESERDYNTMYYFYELGESTAKRSSNSQLEGLSKENAGKMYERMGKVNMAVKYHEAHMSLAHSAGDQVQEERAINQLWRVYMKMGEDSENQSDLHNACLFYEKSLKNAKMLKDKEMISNSLFKLGNVYKSLQDFEKAIEYQQMYTTVCEDIEDKKGKSDSFCALGELYEQTNDLDKAIETYNQFLSSAEEAQDDDRIGTACIKLGMALGSKGQHEESIAFFERSFELAKKSKDNAKIGEAKVRLGFAKGNASMQKHMMSLNKNF